jgi:hypothetical protein
MKILLSAVLSVAVCAHDAFGQGAQGAQIKQRAKEAVNQNNVRQGVPPPSPPPVTPAAPAPGNPAVANPAALQGASISKIKAGLVGFKTGTTATAEQKQRLISTLATAARGARPSLANVKKFVDSLAGGLTEATLMPEQQARLAQNLDAVFNSKPLPASQFDAIIADTQAILQVGGVKRPVAAGIAGELKSVGAEVRR